MDGFRNKGTSDDIQEILGRIEALSLAYVVFGTPRNAEKAYDLVNECKLYSLCAHERSPVITSVRIEDPKKWVRKAAPFIRFSLRLFDTIYGRTPLPSEQAL
jgi:hypothetical protein